MASIALFLSHVQHEAKLADLVEERVIRDFIGLVRVFSSSDQTSILVGSRWLDEVTEALKEAHLHVVLASPESIERKWINFEAGAAHVRNVPIIPLCHSGLTPDQLPVPLSESKGLVLSSRSGFEGFYRAIAGKLGSELPAVDFEAYAADVAAFEHEYSNRQRLADSAQSLIDEVETVRNPNAICVSSQQFRQLGMANQLDTVLNAFPKTLRHQIVLDSMALRAALTSGTFEIVHIAAFVCPRTGTMYFSDVDLRTGRPVPGIDIDAIPPDDFAALLQGARTRLAVITTCESLALATSILTTCHVVAARDLVSSKMMAAWVDAFYARLPNGSLSEALSFALSASGAPMRLYSRQPESIDFRIEQETRQVAGA